MTPERRAKLEAAGHTVADSPDAFFGLDEADRQVNELRRAAADAIRRLREDLGLSQRELAARLEVSQSRVAGIEKADSASLDVILKAYIVLGGSFADFAAPEPSGPAAPMRDKAARKSGKAIAAKVK